MTNPLKAPVTKDQLAQHEGKSLPPKTQHGQPIRCFKCGKYGGTLLKIDDHYEHQNRELCRIFGGK